MNKILIGMIIIILIIIFINREIFFNVTQNCDKAGHSKERTIDPIKHTEWCVPIDTPTTAYYNYNGIVVGCELNAKPVITKLAKKKKCTPNGTKGNCATNSKSTGLVIMCK
jgi:hypothetical protein